MSTEDHIRDVNKVLKLVIDELTNRGINHDASKLLDPEKELFEKYTPMLKKLEYGSEEYQQNLQKLQIAIDHHYANNSHHPEYHQNGIDDMTLIDIIEMWVDWLAAIKRVKDGSIENSMIINKERFKMSDQLYKIFINTYKSFGEYSKD